MTLKWRYFLLCIYGFKFPLCLILNLASGFLDPDRRSISGKKKGSSMKQSFCVSVSLISLVPKKASTIAIAHFRPLRLVSSLYNVVAKAHFKCFQTVNGFIPL